MYSRPEKGMFLIDSLEITKIGGIIR